jgi:hypothetical protein
MFNMAGEWLEEDGVSERGVEGDMGEKGETGREGG